jgi:mannose-6-phosphate isomerase-like protein (cupin superfamily)
MAILRRMEDGIATTRLDDSSPERFVGLRRALGVTSFGMNQLLLRPGQRGRIHVHARQEEVYLVLSGRLTVEIDGTPHDLEEGELMRVAPGIRRRVLNLGPALCSVLALGAAGVHEGRDATAYSEWDAPEGAPPQEIPLPGDLPPSALRDA